MTSKYGTIFIELVKLPSAETIYGYTIEGYRSRPEDYQKPPDYFFPFTKDEVKLEFQKQGKEWRYG